MVEPNSTVSAASPLARILGDLMGGRPSATT
jgi:hypothetical protein